MQNKPNFRSTKANTTSFPPKIYTNIPLRAAPKNKANQTQFQNGKINTSTVITKAYANEQPTTNNEQ
jgi:hypothetical protein